jgi:hypothetical protein
MSATLAREVHTPTSAEFNYSHTISSTIATKPHHHRHKYLLKRSSLLDRHCKPELGGKGKNEGYNMDIATLGGTMDPYNSAFMIHHKEPSHDIILFIRLTWEQRIWAIVLYL